MVRWLQPQPQPSSGQRFLPVPACLTACLLACLTAVPTNTLAVVHGTVYWTKCRMWDDHNLTEYTSVKRKRFLLFRPARGSGRAFATCEAPSRWGDKLPRPALLRNCNILSAAGADTLRCSPT